MTSLVEKSDRYDSQPTIASDFAKLGVARLAHRESAPQARTAPDVKRCLNPGIIPGARGESALVRPPQSGLTAIESRQGGTRHRYPAVGGCQPEPWSGYSRLNDDQQTPQRPRSTEAPTTRSRLLFIIPRTVGCLGRSLDQGVKVRDHLWETIVPVNTLSRMSNANEPGWRRVGPWRDRA